MSSFTENRSKEAILAMLDYLKEEAEQAETVEDIKTILAIIDKTLSGKSIVNRVQGLDHLRAETAASRHNVAMTVPEELITTFYQLSQRMTQLQAEDPETYQNTSNALRWIVSHDNTTVN